VTSYQQGKKIGLTEIPWMFVFPATEPHYPLEHIDIDKLLNTVNHWISLPPKQDNRRALHDFKHQSSKFKMFWESTAKGETTLKGELRLAFSVVGTTTGNITIWS
jgi:hypothetical protein